MPLTPEKKKLVSNAEFVTYLAMAFFFTNLQGMVNTYRRVYLVDVLALDANAVSVINLITNVVPLALAFFFSMVVDRAPRPGKPKFKPLVMFSAVPCGVFAIAMFFTPAGLSELSVVLMIAYQCAVTIIYRAAEFFAGTMNHIQTVISPDQKERDRVISFRSISSAVGNSAPLVVVLVMGVFFKGEGVSVEAMKYLATAALCAVASSVTLMTGTRLMKERVAYNPEKVNPLLGFRDIVTNRHALLLMASEFVKGFRDIASYMGPFLAAALLGNPDKFLLFGLPTGIGTAVGMLAVNALLKKWNSKQIYILSGVYSVVVNGGALAAGALSFRHEGEAAYQMIFIVFLFLIGLQYGASNLLPSMFKADVLEDIEAGTHKRLEASLDFAVSMGTNISKTVSQALAPIILYGTSALGFIQYIQKTGAEYPPQSDPTKFRLLLVYTMGQGVFMLLGALPFLFYRLTGARKARVHEDVLAYREALAKSSET